MSNQWENEFRHVHSVSIAVWMQSRNYRKEMTCCHSLIFLLCLSYHFYSSVIVKEKRKKKIKNHSILNALLPTVILFHFSQFHLQQVIKRNKNPPRQIKCRHYNWGIAAIKSHRIRWYWCLFLWSSSCLQRVINWLWLSSRRGRKNQEK